MHAGRPQTVAVAAFVRCVRNADSLEQYLSRVRTVLRWLGLTILALSAEACRNLVLGLRGIEDPAVHRRKMAMTADQCLEPISAWSSSAGLVPMDNQPWKSRAFSPGISRCGTYVSLVTRPLAHFHVPHRKLWCTPDGKRPVAWWWTSVVVVPARSAPPSYAGCAG